MYHLGKLLRLIKVKVRTVERQKVLRIGAMLVLFLAVLGPAPERVERVEEDQEIEEGQEEGEVPGEEEQFKVPDAPPMASISAQAVYVVDRETGAALFEENAYLRLPTASLTKIMTALIVLQNFSLDEVVTVPLPCSEIPPNEMGLDALEKINVEGLLYGMLVNSGSDAACALSHHFEGDFVEQMNQKARDLGLVDTFFKNETGLDGEEIANVSTAKDLVKLSQEALKNGIIRKIVGTRQVNIPNAEGTRWHNLVSTNELLFSLPGTTGIKTGYTSQAKGCLAVSFEREGREIIAVILGSEDRFADMEKILEWVFKAYSFP